MNQQTHITHHALEYLRPHAESLRCAGQEHHQVQDCTAHLVRATGVSAATAREATMQALGELTARGRRDFIDCNHSTSYTLFLVDHQGARHAFTVQELISRLGLAPEKLS